MLEGIQRAWSPEPYAILHGAFPPFPCALADQFSLELGDSREHGDQQAALRSRSVEKRITDRLERGRISGVRADRPQLTKLMASLRKGDVVLVTKLDRLGRSTRELLQLIHDIDKAGLLAIDRLGTSGFERRVNRPICLFKGREMSPFLRCCSRAPLSIVAKRRSAQGYVVQRPGQAAS